MTVNPDFPDLTGHSLQLESYHAQRTLEDWSRRPCRRQSRARQRARTTWRYGCNLITGLFAVNAATALILGDPDSAAFSALLAAAPQGLANDVPDWYIRAVARLGG